MPVNATRDSTESQIIDIQRRLSILERNSDSPVPVVANHEATGFFLDDPPDVIVSTTVTAPRGWPKALVFATFDFSAFSDKMLVEQNLGHNLLC